MRDTARMAARAASSLKPGRPPDGGWGWVVVLGVSVSYMTNMALFSVFGLLFGAQLESWGLETTGVAFISSTFSCVLNFSGLLVGPMVKHLGAKAVSLIGSLLISCGMVLSYFATKPWHIFLTWGFLAGLGNGLMQPSTFLTISSYFSARRSQAVGIALAGTGLGQIGLPHLVRFLLDQYGFHGAVLILGGVALHSLPGCLLYRTPRLIREARDPDESQPLKEKVEDAERGKAPPPLPPLPPPSAAAKPVQPEKRRPASSGCVRRLLNEFDLLWNPRFLNLAVGVGMIYTTMTSFSMIFPFLLMESVGLSALATATCMSVQSGADLVSRLLLPMLMSRGAAGRPTAGLRARTVMLVGAAGSGISRSVMAEVTGHTELVVMSAVTGLFRGATVLNQNLVIAEHVAAAKLPAAIGMAMVVKGVCVLGLGSALGVVRDVTGSYPWFVHCLTGLALLTSTSWLCESLCCPRTSTR